MRLPRSLTAAVAAVVVIAGLGMGAALAVDDPGAVTYTGCLNPSSGTLSNLAVGSAPVKKCSANEQTVTFGGGDITGVAAGTGLTGGAAAGAATLDLAPSYRLPQNCAAPDVVAKWSGTSWDCAADKDTTFSGTDFATSNQSCTAGKVVTGVDPNGAVTCATDKDTTYDGSNFATSSQSCTAGKVVTGVSATGGLSCDTLPAAGSSIVRGTYRDGFPAIIDINDRRKGENEIGSVDLPTAGPWMLAVTGVISNDASALFGNGRRTTCDLLAPDGSRLQRTSVGTLGFGNDGALGIQFAGNLPAGHYSLVCSTFGGAEDNSNTSVPWLQVNAQSQSSVS